MRIRLKIKKYFGHYEILVLVNKKEMATYKLIMDNDGSYETAEAKNTTAKAERHDDGRAAAEQGGIRNSQDKNRERVEE